MDDGVISLEVYKTDSFITHKNNSVQIQLTYKRFKQCDLYPQLVTNILLNTTFFKLVVLPIANDYYDIKLTPGVYELKEMNENIKQVFPGIQSVADTKTMHSILKIPSPIHLFLNLTNY